MIEGSTGTQGEHSQVVGTTVVGGRHSQVTQVAIVLRNGVLDGHALVVDELEHIVGSSTGLTRSLVGAHIGRDEGHTTILAHQQEVEVGTSPASLPLIVVVLIHLGHVVLVEHIVFELQARELIEEEVTVCNAMIAGRPQRTVGVRGAPSAIIEALDRGTVVGIDRLVGSRG